MITNTAGIAEAAGRRSPHPRHILTGFASAQGRNISAWGVYCSSFVPLAPLSADSETCSRVACACKRELFLTMHSRPIGRSEWARADEMSEDIGKFRPLHNFLTTLPISPCCPTTGGNPTGFLHPCLVCSMGTYFRLSFIGEKAQQKEQERVSTYRLMEDHHL